MARVLSQQGADLRLLVRPSSNPRNLEGLKAETATGDLRDPASLEKAMAGCDTVFHVAADYRLWVRDPNEMYRSNVDGTRAILEAARKSGVRSVVHTSSVATVGFAANGHPADEESQPEDESRGEGSARIHRGLHGAIRWRAAKTVANPAAMNATVAAIERGDARETPHTPWPLVHPPP